MKTVCYISETGHKALCIQKDELISCDACDFNPFPNKVIPEDRVLRGDGK